MLTRWLTILMLLGKPTTSVMTKWLRANAHMASSCSQAPCKPCASVAGYLLGCCHPGLLNPASDSWPVYFLWRIVTLSASIANQWWAQHQNGDQKAEQKRDIETGSVGTGSLLCLGSMGVRLAPWRQLDRWAIDTAWDSSLETARQMGNRDSVRQLLGNS